MSRITAVFAPALVLAAGCALTDYQLITDNDQTANGQGTGIVNTNGKAHVRESSQVATMWPDGNDESIAFVDQKANGDRTLSTYNNFSTLSGEPTFHDDLYCNPDWQGCAIMTAPDPEVGDVDPFDYEYNPNCSGARSVDIMLGTTRYYGECGRARLPLRDRIALLNMGRLARMFGAEGLFYALGPSNASLTFDNNAGYAITLPLHGSIGAFASFDNGPRLRLDLTNPLLRSTGYAYADFLDRHASSRNTLTVTYNGLSYAFTTGGGPGPVIRGSRVRENLNRRY